MHVSYKNCVFAMTPMKLNRVDQSLNLKLPIGMSLHKCMAEDKNLQSRLKGKMRNPTVIYTLINPAIYLWHTS